MMPPLWFLVVVALLIGFLGGWLVFGRSHTAESPIVIDPASDLPPADASGVPPETPVGSCFSVDFSWAMTICGDGDESLNSIAVLGNGGWVAAGWTNSSGSGDFPDQYVGEDGVNGVLVTFTPDGEEELQADASFWVGDVTAGSDGSVFEAGRIDNDVDENGSVSSSASLTQLSPDGSQLWQQVFGQPDSYDIFDRMVVAKDGSIITVGSRDYLDTNTTTAQTHTLLTKFDSNGHLKWQRDLGEANVVFGGFFNGVTVTSDGSIYAVGGVDHSSTKSVEGTGGAMVVKFDTNGNLVWAKSYDDDQAQLFAVGVAADGNIITAGSNLTGGTLMEINGSGKPVWHKTYGDETVQFNAMFIQPSGDIVVAGYTEDSTGDFGSQYADPSSGQTDAAVAKLSANGDLQWAQVYGGSGDNMFTGVTVDREGSVYAVGYTSSADGNLPPSIGGQDAVVVRLTSDGQPFAG